MRNKNCRKTKNIVISKIYHSGMTDEALATAIEVRVELFEREFSVLRRKNTNERVFKLLSIEAIKIIYEVDGGGIHVFKLIYEVE
jgi:hypothetical protein